MTIRTATAADLEAIAAVEAACFPAAEAASKEEFAQRLACYGDHFWLLFDGERLVSFVDGMVSDQEDLTDEMYERAQLHAEDGAWQMIFGVNTLPAYRRRGCAARLLERAIADARAQGRQGLVLTCKEKLLPYYAKFGFKNEGISSSVHGGAVWYQMRLRFAEKEEEAGATGASPMISVIVPVYNAEKFLERTVESICAQTYRNLEILLVDDGSADGSLALCESMARCDSRIRVFHKENGGASSARNLGVREARGGYVGFVDSDDLIAPEMYERLARGAAAAEGGMLSGMVSEAGVGDQIQSGTVSEAGAGGCIPSGGAKPWGQELTDRGRTDPRSAVLVQIGRDEQDEQGRPLPPALLPPEREMLIPSEAFMESLLLYTGDSSFCTKLTPRALLLEHPFPEGVMGEDFLLHMKLLPEIGGVLCLPDTGYHVVHRAGSVTRRLDASQFSRSYIDIVRHADYVEEEVCVRYPSLQRQARRFGLYERLDYLLHVPVSDMTGSNAFYRGVIGYLRRHVADTLRSPYLDRKSRLYLLLFTIAPRTLRRAHKALRRL